MSPNSTELDIMLYACRWAIANRKSVYIPMIEGGILMKQFGKRCTKIKYHRSHRGVSVHVWIALL